jgi:predicted ATP-dependent endonuclease of OLD family
VLVYVHSAGGRLIPISERSEGLRQFIALQAFVESEAQGQNVVLLVDEAENHLHYDAQADLVQMFSEQTVVEKIIYTTHSAACLPPDLGTGIRVIEPCGPEDKDREDWEHSRIRNAFWSTGPGFSPLLMAMGASTFAFSSLRRAVIGEGISEVILLPTLFREATGKSHINFQVAPGISNVRIEDADALGDLDATAARVAYVVDGDKGGLDLKKRLLDAKISEDRIFELTSGAEALTIEDLLVKELYVEALNLELVSKGVELMIDKLPEIGRKAALKKWCNRRKLDTPTEREVAQNLLQIVRARRSDGDDISLLDPSRVDFVKALHDEIEALLAKQP